RDRAWEGRRDGRRRRPPGSRDRARRVSFPRRARPRRRAMLSEEALVFVAAIIACGVLVLGVLELLAPTRSRLPRRPATSNPSPQPRAAPSPRPAREPRPPLVPPTPPLPAPRPAMSASDRIYALWEGKQYAVVESEATAALARGGLSAGETARLWGLIGLARQEQGDVDGARAALEEAIMSAPVEDRAAWQ